MSKQRKGYQVSTEEIARITLKDNPGVHKEELVFSKIVQQDGSVKLDVRVFLDTKVPTTYKGFTKSGFRLTQEQYKELRDMIPLLDSKIGLPEDVDAEIDRMVDELRKEGEDGEDGT